MMRLIGSATLIIAISLLPSCTRVPKEITPQIQYTVQDRYLKNLPSPFAPLSSVEKQSDWGKEVLIGISFAKSLDLYRAITAFRRAEILAPDTTSSRKREIQYAILLCYYLGKRYDEVIYAYTQSSLSQVTPEFPAFHDLLTILYDSYEQSDQCEQAAHILELIHHYYPKTYDTLKLSTALSCADLPLIREKASPEYPYLCPLLNSYDQGKKNPSTAAFLNTILPGSGYLYVGQKQTAVTAFLINGLFIASSVYFFIHGPIAAGIITTSFEAGWYFGGIYGAAYQAKFYNERLYESLATPVMQREGLFPIFRLNYAF